MKRIITYLSFLLIISCNDLSRSNENINDNNIPVNIFPEIIHSGDTISISYNANSKLSQYKDSDDLYATIEVYDKFKIYLHRVKLRKENNKTFSSKYVIPSNAILIKIKISPSNGWKTDENLICLIMDKSNNPQLYAIPLFININSTLDENFVKELLAADEELFPMNYQRYGVIWDQNTRTISFENQGYYIDSVFNILIDDNNKFNKEEFLVGLSVCAKAYSNIAEKKKTVKCLNLILDELNKTDYNNIPYYFFSNLDEVKSNLVLYSSSGNNLYIYNLSDEINRMIFNKLLKIAEVTNNLSFDDKIIKPIDSIAITSNYGLCDSYLKHLYQKYSQLEINDNASKVCDLSQIYWKLSQLLKYQKNYSNAIEIVERGIKLLDKVCQHDNWDYRINNYALLYPLDGILGTTHMIAFNISLENKDTLKAIGYLASYIEKYEYKANEIQSLGNLSFLSNLLTQTYINIKQIDSAKKYLKLTYKFKSPFALDRFNDLNSLLKTDGIELLELRDFENQLVEKVNFGVIKTNTEVIELKRLMDTTLILFFLDDKCSSCNLGINQAFKYIQSKKLPIKIILVSNTKLDDLKNIYGDIFLVINNTKHVINDFKVKNLPYIVVIKKEKIIHRVQNIPNRKEAYEYYLGKN